MAANAGLKQWSHARTASFDLPSGAGTVTYRTLSVAEAVSQDRIPNPLLSIALRAEAGELDSALRCNKCGEQIRQATLTPEETKDFLDLQAHVVANQIEKFKPKKGQGVSGPLDPGWVKFEMPSQDRENLFMRITHIMPTSVAKEVAAGLASLMDASKFRGEEGLAAVSANGEEQGAEAE